MFRDIVSIRGPSGDSQGLWTHTEQAQRTWGAEITAQLDRNIAGEVFSNQDGLESFGVLCLEPSVDFTTIPQEAGTPVGVG